MSSKSSIIRKQYENAIVLTQNYGKQLKEC